MTVETDFSEGIETWTEGGEGADRLHDALLRGLRSALAELKAYYFRRRTRSLLSRLNDRTLADIGLDRAAIDGADGHVRDWSWLPPWRA